MEAAEFAAFAFSYRKRLEDVTSGKRSDRYAREPERVSLSLFLASTLKPRQTLDSREREIQGTPAREGYIAERDQASSFPLLSIYSRKYIEKKRETNSLAIIILPRTLSDTNFPQIREYD